MTRAETPDPRVTAAVALLRGGGVVALPTETVYGLAADAEDELAVRRVFAIKGRPATHPLIVHLPGREALDAWALEVPELARTLTAAFWPGPLTLVLRRSPRASDVVTAGQETVALRVPDHPLTLAVLRAFGGGLAAPSANRFGRVSPTTADHVRADLGAEVDLVLDGGPCAVGLESTIVDLTRGEPVVLRPGALPLEALAAHVGAPIRVEETSEVRVPGALPSHYAPRAGLLLAEPEALGERAGALASEGRRVAVIAPAGTPVPTGVDLLPAPADAVALARDLYRLLREVDRQGYDVALAALPPASGLGLAIRDRLRRAATPRE